MMSTTSDFSKPSSALPFWLSLGTLPLLALGAVKGGWFLLLAPGYTSLILPLMDAALGENTNNPDPAAPDGDLFWYRMVTLIWFPLQAIALYGSIWWLTHGSTMSFGEKVGYAYGVAIVTGSVGIVYAHELMHQKNRVERLLGDLLLATVLYSHYRTEHLLVHHRYVGTPRDSVTARYNQGFHAYFLRIILESPGSAWRAEKQLLARAGRGPFHRSNPFWRYIAFQALAVSLAWLIGGWAGVGFFLMQAYFAVLLLELVDYVEHYGLTRKYLGDGKYEHIRPHHSWNAAHTTTNWYLINLQRHSDHHYKPDRRFPLLQTYPASDAPQLPLGYPAMAALALVPYFWRKRMNPRVDVWRQTFYPEITDWSDYDKGTLPMPKGAS